MNTRLDRTKMMRPEGAKVNINALKQKKDWILTIAAKPLWNLTKNSVEEMVLGITNTMKECAMKTAGREARQEEERLKSEAKGFLKDRREMAKTYVT